MDRRRTGALALVIAVAALALGPNASPALAEPSSRAILPDLAVLAPSDFKIVVRPSGRKLLRFTTLVVNIGRGPFQLVGYDDDGHAAHGDILSVRQQILEPNGTFSTHPTDATMFWSGDGHNHWHVTGIQVSKLQKLSGQDVGTIKKVGFCFLDSYRYGSTKPAYYTSARSVCQTKSNGNVPMGVSVRWGDIYPSSFKYQWVDITGLPNGDYKLKVIADPPDTSGEQFLESRETNNRGWAEIRIKGRTVIVLSKSARP